MPEKIGSRCLIPEAFLVIPSRLPNAERHEGLATSVVTDGVKPLAPHLSTGWSMAAILASRTTTSGGSLLSSHVRGIVISRSARGHTHGRCCVGWWLLSEASRQCKLAASMLPCQPPCGYSCVRVSGLGWWRLNPGDKQGAYSAASMPKHAEAAIVIRDPSPRSASRSQDAEHMRRTRAPIDEEIVWYD